MRSVLLGVVALVLIALDATVIAQGLAIGLNDSGQTTHRSARLRLMHVYGDHVSRHHGVPRPSVHRVSRGATEFGSPVHQGAFIIGDVKLDETVRIGPDEGGNRCLLESQKVMPQTTVRLNDIRERIPLSRTRNSETDQ